MKKNIAKLILIIILINAIILYIPINQVQANSYNQIIINANEYNNNGLNAFPESYKKELERMIQETGHTNWKFKAFYTDIDWNELTNSSNENKCLRNTIYKTNGSWICSCGSQGDSGYYCASAKIVNYYLDPRNFLTETTIFQFLDLSNNTKISVEDIQKAVRGTYLEGEVNGKSYSQMIYDAAEASGENALSLVVKIFQEIGRGSVLPDMITGNNSTYPNTYNFFNYGATDGEGNRLRGLAYANKEGWNTPEKALIEGAKLIADSYVKAGQNTKYTFKFDVVDDNSTGLYWHQYMTNIQDPNNQAKMLYDEYLNNGWLNQDLTFVIPVYKNMPTYVKLPSNLSVNDGEIYFISSTYYNVSLRSGKSTNSEIIDSLKKDTQVLMLNYNEDDSGWSKVRVNGNEGYVYNKYLTKVNVNNDSYYVPEQPNETENEINIELENLEKADINGDGQRDSADLLILKKYLLGKVQFTEAQVKAADTNDDDIIDSADLLNVKRFLLGKISF